MVQLERERERETERERESQTRHIGAYRERETHTHTHTQGNQRFIRPNSHHSEEYRGITKHHGWFNCNQEFYTAYIQQDWSSKPVLPPLDRRL